MQQTRSITVLRDGMNLDRCVQCSCELDVQHCDACLLFRIQGDGRIEMVDPKSLCRATPAASIQNMAAPAADLFASRSIPNGQVMFSRQTSSSLRSVRTVRTALPRGINRKTTTPLT